MIYTYPISAEGIQQKKVELIRSIFTILKSSGLPFKEPESNMFDRLYDKSITELQDIKYKLNTTPVF